MRGKKRKAACLLAVLAVLLCVYGIPRLMAPEYGRPGSGGWPGGIPSAGSAPGTAVTGEAPQGIPDYTGQDVLVLNGNVPYFTEKELKESAGEHYSDPDPLGRCGTAWAMLDRKMMPQGTRSSMGNIRPSGFRNAKYPDLIPDLYLYNRCHLIAWCLTGQEGSPATLFTGTRHLNKDLMLPYETEIASYLDGSVRHVLYRVTPYFKGNELVCRGVELEAMSVEDRGRDLCFHVFLYNVQPGVRIDYRTGESRAE